MSAIDVGPEGDAGSDASSKRQTRKDITIQIAPAPAKKAKHKTPQAAIDEFWAKFDSKTPGIGMSLYSLAPKASRQLTYASIATTIIPENVLAKKARDKTPKGVVQAKNAAASYEEAVAICREKVEKIVQECRRVNQKYLDPHFDIETDLRWARNCLTELKSSDDDPDQSMIPASVKRVGEIFDDPKFFIDGATASDIRQGNDGDCWFLAALCTLGNKPGLIEKVCIARNESVGVYGFVFHRDGEWVSEIIDDKLYLLKPDYDASWLERNLMEGQRRINSEEEYRTMYQTNSRALFFAQCEDPNEIWLPLLEKAYAKAHGV